MVADTKRAHSCHLPVHTLFHCRDPETTEEEELVENLFDVLASCLLLEDNKAVFVEAEGEPACLSGHLSQAAPLIASRAFVWMLGCSCACRHRRHRC